MIGLGSPLIRFKDFLTELFEGSKIAKWKVVNPHDPFLASFSIGNVDYLISINQTTYGSKNPTYYSISFGRDNVPASEVLKLAGNYNLKDTLLIYNTIIDVVRTKLKPLLKTGDEIHFEAADFKMLAVYNRFSKMIAKEISGNNIRIGRIVKL